MNPEKSTGKKDRQRLQLEIGEAALQSLDEMVDALDCATRAELVRKALETYRYLIEARQRGGYLLLELPGQSRMVEIVIPAGLQRLPAAAPQSGRDAPS